MTRTNSLPTVGVVTVVRPEYDANLRAFGMTDANRVPGGGRLHFVGEYQTKHSGRVRLVLSVIGQAGNDTAASLATELIGQFKPQFMFLCGIGAGVRGKNKIGDVVVSRAVVDLTEKVARGGQLLPRPDIDRPLAGVLQMNAAAQVEATDLNARFKNLFPNPIKPPRGKAKEYKLYVANLPEVHEAAIASDNTLLRDPSVLANAAASIHEQIRAGDMEAGGFVRACQGAYPPIPWYVARGISDFGDDFKNDLFHKLASAAVAAYSAAYIAEVLDLRIWAPVEDQAAASRNNRWNVRTGDHLVDQALRRLEEYDNSGLTDATPVRNAIRQMLDSRSALNPYVYYEETASFLFVICWTKRFVMAYRELLSTPPSSPKGTQDIITKLNEVEWRTTQVFGQDFRLTTWIEQKLTDKEGFVKGLQHLVGGMTMAKTELEMRNEIIPGLRELMAAAALVSPG
jgi:nucleoside phosphorylase